MDLKGKYLYTVLGIVAASIHIKTGMHATAEVTPLRNGTGDREADQRCIMNTAFIQGPVSCGLNWVRPKLKHPSRDESEQHHGEEGDVVYAVLGLHPWDKSRPSWTVFTSGVHAWLLSVQPATAKITYSWDNWSFVALFINKVINYVMTWRKT